MTEMEPIRRLAEDALDRGDWEAAVNAATALIEAGEPWLVEGLVTRAMAFERWIDGPPDRFGASASDWRSLIDTGPASVAYRGLARVLLKMGDRKGALVNLLEAQRRANTPEVILGLAEYHRTATPPDLETAKAYYLRAALSGRMPGVSGYVEVAYELDQPYSAVAMTIAALLAAPFLALILGQRRHQGF